MKTKNIITIVLVVVVCIAGFFFFRRKSSTPSLTTQSSTGTTTAGVQSPVGSDLLVLLLQLKSLSLNNRIFSDPTFMSLQDFGQNLVDQPKGRRNPFAAIGIGEAVSASQQNLGSQPSIQTVGATSTKAAGH